LERETGIEPATNSLEGCDSTTELLPPTPAADRSIAPKWWGGEGSNLRSPKAAGLQPAAIDRSATSPKTRCLSEAFKIRLRAGALAGVIHEPLS